MSNKPQKTKAQRERDSEARRERQAARAGLPKDERGRSADDRKAEGRERIERERREAGERAKEARHAAMLEHVESGGEAIEDFGFEGTFNEAGDKILATPGPRLPTMPAFHLVPFKGEAIEGTVEKAYALSPAQRLTFLRKYAESGNIGAAAWHAGTTVERTVRLRKIDPLFDAQIHEAADVFRASLEIEAVRRARDGWQEPVFSQQGMCVIGYKRMYDGRLLEKLLVKNMPEKYGDKAVIEHKVQGVLVLHDDRPISPEEWLNERAESHEANLLKRQQNLLAASAPKGKGAA